MIFIDNTLSKNKVFNFKDILETRKEFLGLLNFSIDGGAGYGETSKIIAKYTKKNGEVLAFEPFAGNHKFFEGIDPRIKLIKKALYSKNILKSFTVSKTVGIDDNWAQKGLLGYSSLGFIDNSSKLKSLISNSKQILKSFLKPKGSFLKPNKSIVECIRIDSIHNQKIDFLKLDLQGGELNALIGLGDLISEIEIMWIEFTGNEKLLELISKNFKLFDTNYMCIGTSAEQLEKIGLKVSYSETLSTSEEANYAARYKTEKNYIKWFNKAKKKGVIQTDILAINNNILKKYPNFITHILEI